jgi:hypothetical protein
VFALRLSSLFHCSVGLLLSTPIRLAFVSRRKFQTYSCLSEVDTNTGPGGSKGAETPKNGCGNCPSFCF